MKDGNVDVYEIVVEMDNCEYIKNKVYEFVGPALDDARVLANRLSGVANVYIRKNGEFLERISMDAEYEQEKVYDVLIEIPRFHFVSVEKWDSWHLAENEAYDIKNLIGDGGRVFERRNCEIERVEGADKILDYYRASKGAFLCIQKNKRILHYGYIIKQSL